MNCNKLISKKASELQDDNSQYFDEMMEKWIAAVETLAEQYFNDKVRDVEDRPSFDDFMDWVAEYGGSFEFEDYGLWAQGIVSSVCDDYNDYLRDEGFGFK